MTTEAYPPHLGWAEPGDPLLFRRELGAEGKWPPATGPTHRDDDRTRPATPFLVIPEDPADNGTAQRTRWATNPSVLLLSGDGKLETMPRKGVSYRIVAIIRNAGDAPSLSTFAEFGLARFTEADLDDAGEIPAAKVNPDEFAAATGLGITAFSVAAGATAWILSRDAWTCPDDPEPFLFAAVRVFDPLHDRALGGWHSRDDRKTALRRLAPRVDGAWSGQQFRTKFDGSREDIGRLSIRVNPDGETVEDRDGSGDAVATVRVIVDSYGKVSGNYGDDVRVPLKWNSFALSGFYVAPGTDFGNEIEMDFARKGDDLVSGVFADGFCEAVMQHAGALPRDPDPAELPSYDPVVPPTWPASRKQDAALILAALVDLGR